MLDVRLSALQLIKLDPECVEDASHARVIGEHHTTNFVLRGYIGAFLGEGHLDRGGPPRDEIRKLALADPLQRLVDLRWVDVTLDDIQNGDVAALLDTCVDENVLGVKQAPHDIKYSCLTD